jgi:hypothetical protein
MDKVKPIPEIGFKLKNERSACESSISELGIFGYFFSDGNKLISNKLAGYLLRTKVINIPSMY